MQITSLENPSLRAVNRDRNYWREVIDVWKESNERPKNFCERMNIKIGTFSHWRGVFAKENRSKENKFIPLEIISPAINKQESFAIECPSGHKIVFSSAIKSDQAQQIFKLLGLIL
jgi:hypothetical protein